MSGFRTVAGFEDAWRPPVRTRRVRPEAVLGAGGGGGDVRARLSRVARRAPEVMVKVTGRTRDPGHLAAHLAYITRNGRLEAEERDGVEVVGREAVQALAADWAAGQLMDSRRRAGAPFSVGIILSMPAGTDPLVLRDAARAFADETFGGRFDHLLVLHTDTDHPHAHMAVRALGNDGRRLNPRKADLEAWRQRFAQALRDRGVEAEATPRGARGVTRKAERTAVRKLRERDTGATPRVLRSAWQEAGRAAFGGDTAPRPWEARMLRRQQRVRALYAAQAALLLRSDDARDRALGQEVLRFVAGMPEPDSRRLALARELRAANARTPARETPPPDGGGRRR